MKTILLLLAAIATSHMVGGETQFTWSYNEKDVFDGDGLNDSLRGPVGRSPVSKGANRGSNDSDDDDDGVSWIRVSVLST
jgi:hypothetical protein